MATIIKSYEEIIEEVRNGWKGKIGDERAECVKNVLDTTLENYSKHTGFSKEEILIAFEKKRNVNCTNWYQPNRFPLLEDIYVFDNLEGFKERFPSQLYVCPQCGEHSTDAYECTNLCGWKIYGLFGDLGKGIHVIIKEVFLENPIPINIFKPIELQ